MSNHNKITLEQLNAELERLSKRSGDGMTLNEMCDHTGHSKIVVQKTLKALQREGRLKPMKKLANAIDGTNRLVPSYVILPAPKKKR